jgi:UDP:flavonoid glycosyltransferase YjiC (YdhE family)
MPILGPDRFLQLAIEELSYHRSDTPGHVSFVGSLPAVRSADVSRPDWWPDVKAAERVVVVTQGTVANEDLGNLVEPTLAALAELPVLVVATTGPRASVRNVPANARVAEFVPFEGLLPHADVLITNGGFGGVQQALRHGTPLVLAGQTEEKFEGNIRVAATGAAINLATDTPAVADIRAAVETVLTDADYRKNAERLAAEYAKLDALAAVAQTVDHLAAS